MKKLNLAIIGIGHWGKNLVREFSDEANVVAYYNRQKESDRVLMQEQYPSIHRAELVQAILARTDIEAVVIATPIATHYELVRDSLRAGKHVFCEKPLCETSTQARELIALAQEHKRTLFVGYTFCYHPIFQKLRDLLKDDPVRYGNFHWQKTGSFRERIEPNLLSHEVSLILGLIGEPRDLRQVHTFGFPTPRDIVALNFSFGDNNQGHIFINRLANIKYKAVTLATAKHIYQWENDRLLRYDPTREKFETIVESDEQPLTRECAAFIRSILDGIPPLTDGAFATHIIELTESIEAHRVPH